ncbi:acyl-CoA reductase [Mycobacterium sp. E1747]|uniref:acyl-CoA reductase n=1 Tax=Mycobacterium sp. E1747 TaxID=1834128 RepID=UPI0007FF667A|nr:acyl-CoA reductase [Mycobacterium sp. E1747]OBH11151.1 long-chain-fatty-acyl-CoA reductase [Mycobacterium sp. E1747]
MTTSKPLVPLVIRGQVITDDLIEHGARADGGIFLSPDVASRTAQLSLADPAALSDIHARPLDEIVDYLVELGTRLDCAGNEHLAQAREMSYDAAPTTPPIVDEQFRLIPALFSREALTDMLDVGIGRAHLDGWVRTALSDGRTLNVRAFGSRCVHITAGNSPMLAALAVIRNALTRGDAIIKSPSNDPLTAAAIAVTMVEMAPDHPETRHLSSAYWRGGDEKVEQPLYQPANLEKIVAWGGFGSIKHVTRYLQPGLELVSFDPKRSASVIGAAALNTDAAFADAAARLAVDIGHLNQAACANARTVFVESGTDGAGIDKLREFGKRVYQELMALPQRVSTRPKRGIAPALRGALDAARFDDEWFTVIGGRHDEGAIIVSHMPEPVDFAAALDDRVANLVPVDSVDEAIQRFDSYTQTVGVYPESLKLELRDAAALSGAQRIVSLGYACAPTFAGPQDAFEPLHRLTRWVTDEALSPATHPLGDLFLDTAGAV